jgi:hypothetical protein
MNSDYYYEIGHSHAFCEDYAISQQVGSELSFTIVSDGCSSSYLVDVGARILTHAAKDYICKNITSANLYALSSPIDPILESAKKASDQIGLPLYALSCTLIMAISNGKDTKVFLYGDGCVVVKHRGGPLNYTIVGYESGAPYYPGYFLSDQRHEDYHREFGRKNVIIKKGTIVQGGINLEDSAAFDLKNIYNITQWNFTDIEFVSIMSDGIESFEKIDGHEHISTVKSIEDVISYKGFSGQFVERRMKALKKDHKKENIGHYDDLSVGTIYLGPS